MRKPSVLLNALRRAFGRKEPPRYEGPFVTMKTRPDRVGDAYTFFWEHENRRAAAGRAVTRSIWEEFRLEVLDVRPDGLKVARTRIASGRGETEGDDESLVYSHAWIGVPVILETELHGAPRRLLNWNEVKAAVLGNVKRDGSDAEHLDATAYLNGVSPQEFAIEHIGSELVALSGVQFRGEVPAGRRDLPVQYAGGRKVLRWTEVSALEADRFRVERVTQTEFHGMEEPLWRARTVATVAAHDGWVIDFETVTIETLPDIGARTTETLKARRLAGPGGEGA